MESRNARTLGRRAFESAALAVVFVLVPELLRPSLVAAGPHPGWIAVLLLATRDGLAGLIAGLAAVAVTFALQTAFAGAGGLEAWHRLHTTSDLMAFGACLGVSWVASWHLRRNAELGETVASLTDRAHRADETVEALQGAVVALRARVDRTASSLSFLRDAAERLEGSDPVAAAEGAADLALARTGASAVAIDAGRDGFRRRLAVRDARGPRMLAPLAMRDAGLTVPMHDGADRVGAIALWGISAADLDAATKRDLEIVASWCAAAIAGASSRFHETGTGAR